MRARSRESEDGDEPADFQQRDRTTEPHRGHEHAGVAARILHLGRHRHRVIGDQGDDRECAVSELDAAQGICDLVRGNVGDTRLNDALTGGDLEQRLHLALGNVIAIPTRHARGS